MYCSGYKTQNPDDAGSENNDAALEERMHGDVLEHKHPEHDYWHPASRIHKDDTLVNIDLKDQKLNETDCYYCKKSDSEILSDILNNSIPRGALMNDCCWKRICQVRYRNFKKVTKSRNWRSICSDRGYYKFGR